MGKRKYRWTVWVIEDSERLRREVQDCLQAAFKRHVLVTTAPSIGWASNMEGHPDVILVRQHTWNFPASSDALRKLTKKHPGVKVGLMEEGAGVIMEFFPEGEPVTDIVAFARKYIGGKDACKT